MIGFPQNRFKMNLYYDGECFIYTDGQSKFIIHPNYKMKISRELVANVNFITATRIKDPKSFWLHKMCNTKCVMTLNRDRSLSD